MGILQARWMVFMVYFDPKAVDEGRGNPHDTLEMPKNSNPGLEYGEHAEYGMFFIHIPILVRILGKFHILLQDNFIYM